MVHLESVVKQQLAAPYRHVRDIHNMEIIAIEKNVY